MLYCCIIKKKFTTLSNNKLKLRRHRLNLLRALKRFKYKSKSLSWPCLDFLCNAQMKTLWFHTMQNKRTIVNKYLGIFSIQWLSILQIYCISQIYYFHLESSNGYWYIKRACKILGKYTWLKQFTTRAVLIMEIIRLRAGPKYTELILHKKGNHHLKSHCIYIY